MPTDEAPLKSIYATASPNTPIVLFDGQGEVSDELHNTAIGSTRVTLDWFPTPRVNFLLESDQDSGIEVGLDYATIKLSNSRTMHGMFTGREISSGGTAGFSEEVRGTAWAEWGPDEALLYVLFSIPNLPDFGGAGLESENAGRRRM